MNKAPMNEDDLDAVAGGERDVGGVGGVAGISADEIDAVAGGERDVGGVGGVAGIF